jgi:hypothetical protein
MVEWFGAHGLQGGSGHGGGLLPLGREYILTQNDQLLPVHDHQDPAASIGASSSASTAGAGTSPGSTLVGSSGGLQIDLLWDSSVQNSANWSSIESAVVSAAKIYTGAFSTHTTLNIQVGYGEVGGSSLGPGALGESESDGYLMSYGQLASALASHDAGLVQAGYMAADAVSAFQNVGGETFFVPSAEAKALGLVGAGGTDGYIGLTKSSALYFPADGGTIGAGQYDAVGVAAHELSEVMGRIGMVGASLGGTKDVYTPLDIFRYSSSHVLDLTAKAAHFSLTDGATNLGYYNNPSNGGDASDWASTSGVRDAYNAFDNPGVMTRVTKNDLLEVASLGYSFGSSFILKGEPA